MGKKANHFKFAHIGEQIRRLRLGNHMSLTDLAAQIDTSRSFLSQLEQGKTLPSLSTLKSIANSLGVTVGSLIDDPEENNQPTIKADERPRLQRLQAGVSIEALTHREIHKQMQPILVTLKPKAISGHEGYVHQGQEFGYVLKGQLKVELEGTTHVLDEGDSIYFDSSRPHQFTNVSDDETIALWVVCPPSF